MSTGTDDARLEQDQTGTPAGEQPAASDRLTITSIEVIDPDDAELTAAKTAAQAEEAGGDGDGQGSTAQVQPAQPAALEGQDPQSAAAPAAAEAPVMIPKARLDEALQRARDAELEAARWRGQAEARSQMQPPAQPGALQPAQPQPPQPTPAERLDAVHTAQDALATRFDNGEITYAELLKEQRTLAGQEQQIREDMLLARIQPASQPQQSAGSDELYLNTLTAQLEDQHPWVAVADQVASAADWDWIKNKAVESLVGKGIDPRAGAEGRYELRREIAELWDQTGPFLLTAAAQAKGIAIPTPQPQPAASRPQQPGAAPTVVQQRQSALQRMENAPPNIQSMGGAIEDNATGAPSESRLESMSDDEIGALPEATRRKLLGIT